MSTALAYVNWSRWIAECPADGCHDARELVPGQPSMTCAVGHVSPVRWPGGAATVVAINDALANRPDESTRNWLPGGHPLAAALDLPTDQTPADLAAETAAYADAAADLETKRRQAIGLLDELGLTVAADGTIQGRLTADDIIDGKV